MADPEEKDDDDEEDDEENIKTKHSPHQKN